jgi:Uma2 family endonuclease
LDRLDLGAYDAVQEMRLEVAGKIRYPEVSVCAGRILGGIRTIQDAVVIIEVLSDDTAETDRRQKPDEYAQLPSLRRYLLLEQEAEVPEVWTREEGKWKITHVTTGAITLPEIAIEVPLPDIYQGV